MNGLSDISVLQFLPTTLKSLDLGFNKIKSIVALKHLVHLIVLKLHCNKIDDLTPLCHLPPTLELLVLGQNKVKECSCWTVFPSSLKEIDLGGNKSMAVNTSLVAAIRCNPLLKVNGKNEYKTAMGDRNRKLNWVLMAMMSARQITRLGTHSALRHVPLELFGELKLMLRKETKKKIIKV